MQEFSWRRVLTVAVVAGVALVAPRAVHAQTGKISGVVTNAADGQPIEGVQVRVVGTGYGALTQPNGRFFIISVPPGTYTVEARRIGFQSAQTAGVQVGIDVTRTVNFSLSTASTVLTAVRTVAPPAPLVERGVVGSSTSIQSDVIQSLPVTSIAGVLALQQGFTEVPQNTQLLSLSEEQRSTTVPVRVRGGRGGSTITLIDGIPINNPLFGTEAVKLNPLAVQAVQFDRGYMEPQYGNGLSGVISQAVREGGTEVAGAVDYQSSSAPGTIFNSKPDKLNDYNLLRGYLSGPVPGTATKLRYSVSGQLETGAARVLQFDDLTYTAATRDHLSEQGLNAATLDLIPGWRAFGARQNQQIVGKLTFLPTNSTTLKATVIDQQRQSNPFDRRCQLVCIGDPFNYVHSTIDSLAVAGSRNARDFVPTTVRDQSRLYALTAEQRFGRSSLTLRAARMDLERNSCNVYLGICIESPFTRPNFTDQFFAPFGVPGLPFTGTGDVYGGEDYSTNTFRADFQSQVSDHHNILLGGSFLQHDIVYSESRGIGGNSGVAPSVNQLYRVKPIEAAGYVQDRIEFDFLTIKIGARYDYGLAKGRGFRDPLNPTAGTTAREVCEGTAGAVGATTRYTFQTKTASGADTTLTGASACLQSTKNAVGRPFLLDSAARVAQRDDFQKATPRTAFSPRIGVSFPLSERSQVFFNAGRYTMNPLYANLYRNTGIGTVAGSRDAFCKEGETKPGTNECVPPLTPDNPDFLGNPNLRLEQATQYEVGYGGEFGSAYAFNVAVYNRNETGLSGLQRSRAVQDIGATYAGIAFPQYQVTVNQDFLTSRGLEVQLRRRVQNYWGYDFNYGYSRTTANSPPPERSFEIDQGGEVDRTLLRELTSDIDQPHRFNGTLILRVDNNAPRFRYGSLLRNSSASITYSFSSGFPYTPIRGSTVSDVQNQISVGDINAGRAPSIQLVNLLVDKAIRVANVQYSLFYRVDNLLDRKNCVQVFVNTGNCTSGLRDPLNRRVGNTDESVSTSFDQPDFMGARRSMYAGLSIKF